MPWLVVAGPAARSPKSNEVRRRRELLATPFYIRVGIPARRGCAPPCAACRAATKEGPEVKSTVALVARRETSSHGRVETWFRSGAVLPLRRRGAVRLPAKRSAAARPSRRVDGLVLRASSA